MQLCPATLADLELLRLWDRQPHIELVSGEDGYMDWATELPRLLSWREILIARTGGRAIGAIVIIDPAEEETHYWGKTEPDQRAIDIWIGEPDCLGKGYGTQMMRLALQRCFAAPEVHCVLIDPLIDNLRAIRFYEHLGFERVGPRCFGGDECMVLHLARNRWEQA